MKKTKIIFTCTLSNPIVDDKNMKVIDSFVFFAQELIKMNNVLEK